MATAQVLFQRFWFVTSLKHFGIRVRSEYTASAAALRLILSRP